MPIINLTITGQPDKALSKRLAAQMTDLTKNHLKKDPTVTAVAIHYVDPEHWFAGGLSLAEQAANTFWLDIKVVDGSNTKGEIETYIEDVFNAVGTTLGSTHTESYILVHEVPAASYGYGGKTQEFRFVSGKLKSSA